MMDRKQVLQNVKERLQEVYGDRLRGVVLYGSEARGEADADSDVDMLVLIDGPGDWWSEARKIIDALYDLVLEIERPIHALPVAVEDFNAGKYALYRTVQNEGVFL